MSKQPSGSQRRSRRAQRREEMERQAKRRRLYVVGGAVGLAIVVALGLILVPHFTGGGSAAAITLGVAPPEGVPTDGQTMGDPNATVTVVEWGDYQ